MISSYKQVLAHADATQRCEQRLRFARAIAQEYGAALNVVYAVGTSFTEMPYVPEITPSISAELFALDDERRNRAREVFDRVCSGSADPVAWSEVGEPVVARFAEQALYADLLVLGQFDRSDKQAAGLPRDFVESVILSSGRPAVVVPYAGPLPALDGNVVIAWKPTREAARAVMHALPLLGRARHLHVVTWGPSSGTDEEIAGSLTLTKYLRLHGIDSIWHDQGPETAMTGELLLSRAADLEADMIVMGCYGHGRAREWVLGGTSRTVLQSMTVPVFMSH